MDAANWVEVTADNWAGFTSWAISTVLHMGITIWMLSKINVAIKRNNFAQPIAFVAVQHRRLKRLAS